MKPSTVRPLLLRYFLLLPVVVLGVATILATASPVAPTASVVLNNATVTNNKCQHVGTGVTCTFEAQVQVKNYTFTTTTATFVTTDLLVAQVNGTSPANLTTLVQTPSFLAFVHAGAACTGPETTLAVYDGYTDTGTFVATVPINIILPCQ